MKPSAYVRPLASNCPSAPILWSASRVMCDVYWTWEPALGCYTTHQWSRDTRPLDVRVWDAPNPLSSVLRALREDERLAGQPVLRWLALDIAMEYVSALVEARKL